MPNTVKLNTPFEIHSVFSLDGVFPGNQKNHVWFANYSDWTDNAQEKPEGDWHGLIEGPLRDDDYSFHGSTEQELLDDLLTLVKELKLNPKDVYVQRDVTI